MPLEADNAEAVLKAHRAALETMPTTDLARLLIVSGNTTGRVYQEDEWFRELIVDVLKERKI
jgi:hypothetical protein